MNHIHVGSMSLCSAVQEIPTIWTAHGTYQDYFYILSFVAPIH